MLLMKEKIGGNNGAEMKLKLMRRKLEVNKKQKIRG